MIKNTCFTDEKRHRVYVQNVPVCTGTTRTHVQTCVRVVPVHTGTFWTYTRRRVEWTHGTTHHTAPRRHTKTSHGDRDRDGDRDKERREDGRAETRQEKRRQKKTRQDKRREKIHFAVWWCMAVFCWCSDFLVDSVCARFLSLLNSVKYDSFSVF